MVRVRLRRSALRRESVEVGKGNRLAPWLADAAVERVFDDHGVDDLVRSSTVEADDVRPELGVLTTGAPPAEAAGAESGLLTRPAVHVVHLWGALGLRAEG